MTTGPSPPCPMKGCASGSKKRSQALAEERVVHPQGERRLRGAMEEVLDLYEEPYDPRRPVVCFDETSTQLLAQTRPALPPRPGIP